MSVGAETNTITITLDGHEVTAQYRETVIAITRRFGIDIPTLCHHEALEPAGACRLCLVEIEKRGRKKIVTACNFPVEDGMAIRTNTEEVQTSRRMTIESLLARCPGVPEIRRLATKLGVERSRFVAEEDTCILCSLCTRACETYVTTAISTVERGTKKYIGTFAGDPPEECVGCGACAEICPTDHIKQERDGTEYRIWGRRFDLAVCDVDEDLCRACGACEEACPWSIPRVVLRRGGSAVATIRPEVCKACGVCVAACPSAAIRQRGDDRSVPAEASSVIAPRPTLVYACGRSNLGADSRAVLPDGVVVRELSCAGSVSQAQLLGALTSGFAGVLVLGRHEETCRLDGAESHGRATVRRVDQLAELTGLGAGRVQFVEPAAGAEGPLAAVAAFTAGLAPSPLTATVDSGDLVESQDAAATLLTWLSTRDELTTNPSSWLASWGLSAAQPGKSAVLAAAVPYLDIMLEEWIGERRVGGVLRDAVEVLAALGIDAGVAIGGFRGGEERLVRDYPGSTFYSLCGGCGGRIADAGGSLVSMTQVLSGRGIELSLPPMAGLVAASPHQAEVSGLAALGARVAAIDDAPQIPHDLAISRALHERFVARLRRADEAGARALLVATPVELYQMMITQRRGAWRQAHVEPLLPVTIAAAGLRARTAERRMGA